jgi:hypothetical protein
MMRRIVGTIALTFVFGPLGHAEETIGDKAAEAARAAGKDIREAGREMKAAGRKARQAVVTRCADGRHTVKGASGCARHGGVRDPK